MFSFQIVSILVFLGLFLICCLNNNSIVHSFFDIDWFTVFLLFFELGMGIIW